MKRRTFLTASVLAGMAPLSRAALADQDDATAAKQFHELRLYQLEAGEKAARFAEFLGQVAIPALNRIGISPVGVFSIGETNDPVLTEADLYVLLNHTNLESVVTSTEKLLADEEYRKAGADILNAPKNSPAFKRVESSLSLAFDECPKVEVPSKKESRVLQLRVYESHTQPKAKKKVEMFNEGGEIAIFRRVGLHPVFFGESLIGTRLPNLTYMLGFDDVEAKEVGWNAFLADPAWTELKGKPEYKDTVSRITNTMLRPVAGSQI